MKVIVDADASPVKEIIYEETKPSIPVVLVSSIDHYSNQELPNHVSPIYVEAGRDAADFKILSIAKKGDLVVTQDFGLASLILAKDLRVLHHTGFEYTAETIDTLLAKRHYSAMVRQQGGRTKGPKKLSSADKEKFRSLLRKILHQ